MVKFILIALVYLPDMLWDYIGALGMPECEEMKSLTS